MTAATIKSEIQRKHNTVNLTRVLLVLLLLYFAFKTFASFAEHTLGFGFYGAGTRLIQQNESAALVQTIYNHSTWLPVRITDDIAHSIAPALVERVVLLDDWNETEGPFVAAEYIQGRPFSAQTIKPQDKLHIAIILKNDAGVWEDGSYYRQEQLTVPYTVFGIPFQTVINGVEQFPYFQLCFGPPPPIADADGNPIVTRVCPYRLN